MMARYRKVDPRIWNDAKFRSMSDDGKLIFFFLLTHPHMTMIGAMRASIPGLAAEIGWELKRFAKGFGEPLSKGMANHDPEASFLWLPHFLRYNPPDNPNVVKSWASIDQLLPECDMKTACFQASKEFSEGLGKRFAEGFAIPLPKPLAKGMPKQEQEQEQEQETYLPPKAAAGKTARKANPVWDAICGIWHLKPETKAEQKNIGRLARDFGAKINGRNPWDAIEAKIRKYKRTYPNAPHTPDAVLKHWDLVESAFDPDDESGLPTDPAAYCV